MDVKFAPVIANADNFPEPVIRATPGFSLADIRTLWQSDNFDQCTITRNGRAAIGIAAQQLMQPHQPNIVLLPAYHCPALVEPFLWLGYEVRFYPVLPDLSVDAEQFIQLLTDDVTHCMFVRFFGFKQNIEQLITLSHAAGKVIIEDCAHSLVDFVAELTQPDARVSARICSINKILPTIDGGLLYLNAHSARQPQHCGWYEELKGVAYLLKIPKLLQRVRKKRRVHVVPQTAAAPARQPKYKYFLPSDLTSASFRHTKLILQCSNFERIKARRLKNYAYLTAALANAAAGRCLYPCAADEAPYVLPFLLHDERDFQRLRQQKIQVLRWEEVAYTGCAVSEHYRSRLIQLPCHHKLTQAELDYIIHAVRSLAEKA
jgi:perosamine synthetase